jgi:recombination protein RecR
MDPMQILSERFARFPGIGPRQAGRFVHFLLRSSAQYRRELANAILGLSETRRCSECYRFHTGEHDRCDICADASRDSGILAVVAHDTDLDALERSGAFRGGYFVVGGTISLATERASTLREKELLARLATGTGAGLTEVVLAFPANPEGDYTASQLRALIASEHPGLRISQLGRGLSTGSELEYADPDTLKSAFSGRR